jgi:hypothetical protein
MWLAGRAVFRRWIAWRYDGSMDLSPHCDRAEWLDRATMALGRLMPGKSPAEIAEIVSGHLWEEACDLSPEEAAEIYACESPPE